MKPQKTGITLVRIPISRANKQLVKDLWDLFRVTLVLVLIPTCVVWLLQVAECRAKNPAWTVMECSRPHANQKRRK